MKIAIVASHASSRSGGEAFVPFNLFRQLHERGIPCYLLTHERSKEAIYQDLDSKALKYVHFVPDSLVQKILGHSRGLVPEQLCTFTFDLAIHLITERYLRALVTQMIKEGKVDLVHKPVPISPRMPSFMCGLQVPLVLGPFNGAMDYPPAFSKRRPFFTSAYYRWGRALSGLANWIIPGKRQADLLLVANTRTKSALPSGVKGEVIELAENGVDIERWDNYYKLYKKEKTEGLPTRFLYVGSFVECKAIDLLLHSFAALLKKKDATLTLVGNGPKEAELKKLSESLGIEKKVHFLGWLSHEEVAREMAQTDVFTFPSLKDCGGAVLLEAMAMKLPIICARWGGPADYVSETCGILVDPSSHQSYIENFYSAMLELSSSEAKRQSMGLAGYEHILCKFQWKNKIDQLIHLYEEVLNRSLGS